MPYYEFPRSLQTINLQVSKCLIPTNKTRQKGYPCTILLTWTKIPCSRTWILSNPHITQRQPKLPLTCANSAPVGTTRRKQITREHRTTTISTTTVMTTTIQSSIRSHLTPALRKNQTYATPPRTTHVSGNKGESPNIADDLENKREEYLKGMEGQEPPNRTQCPQQKRQRQHGQQPWRLEVSRRACKQQGLGQRNSQLSRRLKTRLWRMPC